MHKKASGTCLSRGRRKPNKQQVRSQGELRAFTTCPIAYKVKFPTFQLI